MFRIAAVPLIIILMLFPNRICTFIAALLFSAAAITDYFDGFLARKRGLVTTLGKVMDPVADKLIVSVALIMLASAHPEAIIVLGTCIIVGREIIISNWSASVGPTEVTVSIEGHVSIPAAWIKENA